MDVTVTCPVCGEGVISCNISAAIPASRTSPEEPSEVTTQSTTCNCDDWLERTQVEIEKKMKKMGATRITLNQVDGPYDIYLRQVEELAYQELRDEGDDPLGGDGPED